MSTPLYLISTSHYFVATPVHCKMANRNTSSFFSVDQVFVLIHAANSVTTTLLLTPTPMVVVPVATRTTATTTTTTVVAIVTMHGGHVWRAEGKSQPVKQVGQIIHSPPCNLHKNRIFLSQTHQMMLLEAIVTFLGATMIHKTTPQGVIVTNLEAILTHHQMTLPVRLLEEYHHRHQYHGQHNHNHHHITSITAPTTKRKRRNEPFQLTTLAKSTPTKAIATTTTTRKASTSSTIIPTVIPILRLRWLVVLIVGLIALLS